MIFSMQDEDIVSNFFKAKNTFFSNLKLISKFSFLILLILFFLSSCTGINLRSWPLPISPNTHPTESYSKATVLFKGGAFYHSDSTVLFSGTGRLERKGTSCSHSFLYLIAFGSSRIYDAKVEGAINAIGLIEEEVFAILGGFYHRHCTIVTGEAK